MNHGIAIRIGITRYEPGWELLLEQIGVDWFVIPDLSDLSPSALSLLIVNSAADGHVLQSVMKYAHDGGAVLFTTGAEKQIRSRATGKQYLTFLPPQVRKEYSFSSIFDLYRTSVLFNDSSITFTEDHGAGTISYLGLDVQGIIDDRRIVRKAFPADSHRLPTERVAQGSKNALRQLIHTHIEYLHHRRNIPFVHKWYYPDDTPTVFTFRVDSDKGTQEQIDEIYRICDEHRIPTSWFLDVHSHESWLPYFKKFTSQEIGIHCYRHVVHDSVILNKENFAEAKAALERQGLRTEGITAPTGAWNRYIGTAILELEFSYSSEFGYDYDNLPSFPFVNSSFSPVVQLPIHPICVGSMLQSGFLPSDMISYFKQVVDKKRSLAEPICLYHHPTHGHTEVFQEVFKYIHSLKIATMSYSDYALWWKRRSRNRMTVNLNDTDVHLGGNEDEHQWARITMPDSRVTIVPALKTVNLKNIPFKIPAMTAGPVYDSSRVRRFSVRHIVQDLLDWWIKSTE
jgi:hypothetical protein